MTQQSRRMVRSCFLAFVFFVLLFGVPTLAAGPFLEGDVVMIHSLAGENVGDGFGWVGAQLGDLDGDGAEDFLVTAPFYGGDGAGKIYVYSGAEAVTLHEESGNPGDFFGYSASSAGDVNGDGTPDYIVGGPGAGGRAVVYSGAEHAELLVLPATSEEESFGASVAGAGDVNGDGYADLIVGATRFESSATVTDTGKIVLFSGLDGAPLWTHAGDAPQGLLGSGVGMVGDVNGDDVPDQVAAAPGAGKNGLAYVFSGVDGAVLHTLEPVDTPESGNTFGRFFASGAGDVDGDGVPDIFVGDYAGFRGDAADTGRAYFFSGADGAQLHVFEAEEDGDGLGPGRGIPDVDGDGLADAIVAAWTSDAGAPGAGKVYLYRGADGTLLHSVTGTLANDSLGVDALSIGDVNGDGQRDYLLTAVGLDFAGEEVGKAYVVTFAPSELPELQPLLASCAPPGGDNQP